MLHVFWAISQHVTIKITKNVCDFSGLTHKPRTFNFFKLYRHITRAVATSQKTMETHLNGVDNLVGIGLTCKKTVETCLQHHTLVSLQPWWLYGWNALQHTVLWLVKILVEGWNFYTIVQRCNWKKLEDLDFSWFQIIFVIPASTVGLQPSQNFIVRPWVYLHEFYHHSEISHGYDFNKAATLIFGFHSFGKFSFFIFCEMQACILGTPETNDAQKFWNIFYRIQTSANFPWISNESSTTPKKQVMLKNSTN